ncbi:MAG: hypothetical protein NTY09_13650 [bacterium]|nr:hypothetical protein [bacterium]
MASFNRIAIIFLILLVVGCQSGGGQPVSPDLQAPGSSGQDLTSGDNTSHEPAMSSGSSCLGLYDISIDPVTLETEIIPARTAQLTVNIMGFVQMGSAHGIGIEVTDFTELWSAGRIKVDLSITNPFDLDWTVAFDTLGVFISKQDTSLPSEPGATCASSGSDTCPVLENADGLTRWMNPVEFYDPGMFGFLKANFGDQATAFDATLNPYKYFATGIGKKMPLAYYLNGPAHIENRGALFPLETATREYVIRFPLNGGKPVVHFQFAVVTHWDAPMDGVELIEHPSLADFPPGANMQEAHCIVADVTNSSLYYENETEKGGSFTLNLNVYDWQGKNDPGGAIGEIDKIVLDSPDGPLPSGPVSLDSLDLQAIQMSTGPNSTSLDITVENCEPPHAGLFDIMVAVYSADPDTYGQDFPKAYPETASLAAFQLATIEVLDEKPSVFPIIDQLLGNTAINCDFGEVEYTCIAHDPDGDPLIYAWEVNLDGVPPTYASPLSTNPTLMIDWADGSLYPLGEYDVWVKVSDGFNPAVEAHLDVTKSEAGLVIGMISAETQYINDVLCSADGAYSVDASDCNPDAVLEYRFIRKYTSSDDIPASSDPDWTPFSINSEIVFSWDQTDVGDWRIWANVREQGNPSIENYSPALAVTRANSLPAVDTPTGPSSLDCEDISEFAVTIEDCDAGDPISQEFYLSTNPTSQTGGSWISFTGETFEIDFEPVLPGQYYLFARAEDESTSTTCLVPLAIVKTNTAPETPSTPAGPQIVDCSDPVQTYQAGIVEDCDISQTLARSWATNTFPAPPVAGWTDFTGETFDINWEPYSLSNVYLYQRVGDGTYQTVSSGLPILVTSGPPEVYETTGASIVYCDSDEYYAVDVIDCDPTDIPVLSWYLSIDSGSQVGGAWNSFTGDTFNISFDSVANGTYYLFIRANDGLNDVIGDSPLEIIKDNTPPGIPSTPSGPEEVSCKDDTESYFLGSVTDCDEGDTITRFFGISDGGEPDSWVSISLGTTSIDVNWASYDDGQYYYLYQAVDDGTGKVLSSALEIWKIEEAVDFAIFVAPASLGGSDANPGTESSPKASIGTGISAAVSGGYNTVYVAQGNYVSLNTLTLHDGINIYGGYEYNGSDCWLVDEDSYSTFTGPATGTQGINITSDTEIYNMIFKSSAASGDGNNSTGLYLSGCSSNLSFNKCQFIAANGSGGSDEVDGTDGSWGSDGTNGEDASVSEPNPGPGGSNICDITNVSGGDGGGSGWSIFGDGSDGDAGQGPGGGGGGFADSGEAVVEEGEQAVMADRQRMIPQSIFTAEPVGAADLGDAQAQMVSADMAGEDHSGFSCMTHRLNSQIAVLTRELGEKAVMVEAGAMVEMAVTAAMVDRVVWAALRKAATAAMAAAAATEAKAVAGAAE